jgi:hypothetical protein
MRCEPSPTRSRTRGQRTLTGPMPPMGCDVDNIRSRPKVCRNIQCRAALTHGQSRIGPVRLVRHAGRGALKGAGRSASSAGGRVTLAQESRCRDDSARMWIFRRQ